MKFKHTDRPGFWLGFTDFFTAGLFFLVYMPMGLQDELEFILGHKVRPYWQAYLLGIPDLSSGLDGRDCGRTEGEGSRTGYRRSAYILEAYVLVEHAGLPLLWADDSYAQVFQNVESGGEGIEQTKWSVMIRAAETIW